MTDVYLSLGSNLGDRLTHLVQAIDRLAAAELVPVAVSSVYETEPVDCPDDLPFLNAASRMQTRLPATQVLARLQAVEAEAGRKRPYHHAPRPLDLDILLFDGDVIHTPDLVIPHPALHIRRFVLCPLAEIAASVIHPLLHQSVSDLLRQCADPHRVDLYCKWPGLSV